MFLSVPRPAFAFLFLWCSGLETEIDAVLAPVRGLLDEIAAARDHRSAVYLAWQIEELGAVANQARD